MSEMRDSIRGEIDRIAMPNRFDQIREGSKVEDIGFDDLLKSAIEGVHGEQVKAKDLATRYEMGDPTVDLPQVMIQSQKASVAFEAMTQVRNRLVKSYEDIINMSI